MLTDQFNHSLCQRGGHIHARCDCLQVDRNTAA